MPNFNFHYNKKGESSQMMGFRTRVIGRTVGSQGLNRISTAYSNRHNVERLPSCLCECAKSQILISQHQLIDDGWYRPSLKYFQ